MGSWIAAELVGNELPGWFPLMPQHLAKKAFGGFAISPACHQNIDHVSILIHRSPQIVSLALDRDEELVNVPDVACSPLLSSQRAGVVGSKLLAPSPNRLIRDGDTSLGEQVFDLSKT